MTSDSDTKSKNWQPQKAHLPQVMTRNERRVRKGFWQKIARVLSRIPFAEDVVAAYFCAMDQRTPRRARGLLLAALVYFITPIDMIPDMIVGLGFTDDAAVLATVISIIASHMKPEHRQKAVEILKKMQQTN